MGRPSIKTPKLIKAICARLETGEPLVWICRDPGMPCVATVTSWERSDEEVSSALAHAREIGGDAIAADALAIADETSSDTRTLANGEAVPNSEWISRSRLRVETRLKLLAVWHPKRYGPKQQVEHSGGVNVVAGALDASL